VKIRAPSTAKLDGSHFEMLLVATAERVEKSKRGDSAAKGSKRISASQPSEGYLDLELLLCDMLETSPALLTAKVLVPSSHRSLSYLCLIANVNSLLSWSLYLSMFCFLTGK
jgi:hypothetical protein